jgi:predicted GIY-YIG superfamily endonuclease
MNAIMKFTRQSAEKKIIKKWKRKFKVNAIEKMNPEWKNLYFEIFSTPAPATSAG